MTETQATENVETTQPDESKEPKAAEVSADESKKKDAFIESFERLRKHEGVMNSQREKLNEARKELESYKHLADTYSELKNQKNPFEVLQHFGITYEMLEEAAKRQSGHYSPELDAAIKKAQAIEERLLKKEKDAEELELSKKDLEVMAYITETVRTKEYDLIEKFDGFDAVKDYMQHIFLETKEVPTVEEACEAITQSIVKKITAVQNSKWLQKKEPEITKKSTSKFEEAAQKLALKPKATTLSNKMTQSSGHVKKPMTSEERLAAAVAMFK